MGFNSGFKGLNWRRCVRIWSYFLNVPLWHLIARNEKMKDRSIVGVPVKARAAFFCIELFRFLTWFNLLGFCVVLTEKTRCTVQRRKFQLNITQGEREIIVRNEMSVNNRYRSDENTCVVRLRKEHNINYKIVKSNRKRKVWLEENWHNSVHIRNQVTRWMTEELWFDCQQEQNVCLFSEASSEALGPIQHNIHCVSCIISTGINWPGRETHHSLPPNKVDFTI
jgi:hypothetical protein